MSRPGQNGSDHSFRRRCLRLLGWFCPPALYEGIEGDLLEKYERDLRVKEKFRAQWGLALAVLKFFRPGIMLRNEFRARLINTIMLENYLKVAARNIGK